MKRWAAAFAAAACLMGSAAAQDSPGRAFDAAYGVRIGSVTAGEFTFNARVNGAAYTAAAERRATGLVRTMAGDSQDYRYSTRGRITDQGPRPSAYQHSGGRRDRVVNVAWTGGAPTTTSNPPMGMGDPPATEAQKAGTIDQVSALVAMLTSERDPCARTLRVFMDGRARFDFVMRADGRERFRSSAWSGQAVRCAVQFRPIAGFSDPQEAASMVFLFAPLSNGWFAPLRIQMPSDNGLVTLDIRRFSVS
ncbi:MAG: DUF3108 domain-containing protein [Alphaproteobacteria bacterium]|nr:DUF3108 domain-containing protein [Alphaproteobacteria bacterium]